MEGTKGLLGSTTIWGVIITVVGLLLTKWGYAISPTDSQFLVNFFAGLFDIVGPIVAVIGRIRATKKIG